MSQFLHRWPHNAAAVGRPARRTRLYKPSDFPLEDGRFLLHLSNTQHHNTTTTRSTQRPHPTDGGEKGIPMTFWGRLPRKVIGTSIPPTIPTRPASSPTQHPHSMYGGEEGIPMSFWGRPPRKLTGTSFHPPYSAGILIQRMVGRKGFR
ncbi:uncharacterized protein TrAtP1_005066 [Trichoderma atroviride]|uniref:uncharacterized protein n=1 Tax=Hypocrea atroviridis TaxID=63577 RepID=UPI00332C0650|nr:hypothetical protein TrAtP1_005066 [Trichoderma atroviride]